MSEIGGDRARDPVPDGVALLELACDIGAALEAAQVRAIDRRRGSDGLHLLVLEREWNTDPAARRRARGVVEVQETGDAAVVGQNLENRFVVEAAVVAGGNAQRSHPDWSAQPFIAVAVALARDDRRHVGPLARNNDL
jgi:hypothetical protein